MTAIPNCYIHQVPSNKFDTSCVPKKIQLVELLNFVLPDEIKRDPEALHFIYKCFITNSFSGEANKAHFTDVSEELRVSGYYSMSEVQKATYIRKWIQHSMTNPTTDGPDVDKASITFTSDSK